jgi:DNA-directed RNA polymerase specialized sigma24 family protein
MDHTQVIVGSTAVVPDGCTAGHQQVQGAEWPVGHSWPAALRRLSADQRTAIALHYFVGLSVAEVATETAAPIGTVKARLARGRTALAPYLKDGAFYE